MHGRIAIALGVFALSCGCRVEPEPDPLDAPRHERCTEMSECAKVQCLHQMEAVEACYLSTPNCSSDVASQRMRDRTACLDDNGCNLTRCTVRADGQDFECEDEAEQEILDIATDQGWYGSEVCLALDDVDGGD